MLDNKRLRCNWRKHLQEVNITYINDNNMFKKIYNPRNTIICSRCSKTKTGKNKATPKEFYVSPLNLKFYRSMEKNSLYYAILSDKYGIHFCDEYLDFYDVHPSILTKIQKVKLGGIIRNKCNKRNYKNIIFYNSSPLMSSPYFQMLLYSGLKIYFVTDLNVFDRK